MEKFRKMRKVLLCILYVMLSGPAVYAASAYSNLLKSNDAELKYNAALDYYEKKQYGKTIALLEDIQQAYRGSEQAEHILYVLANSYYNRKDYYTAAHYFENYVTSYLQSLNFEECQYMLAKCHYMQSPHPELDQTETLEAIERLQIYLNLFPQGGYAVEARTMLAEMYDKLARRELYNAQLYYDLGNYRGNNYRAAVITAHNAMNDFPDSKYKEDFAFIIVNSKYKEAINSVSKKMYNRCEDAWDECHYFLREYPDSKHAKDVEKTARHLKKILENHEIETNEPVYAID